MKLLLDTHAFIWWDSQADKLSAEVLALCMDRTNSIYLSVASIWEMQIKTRLGNLTLNMPLKDVIEGQRSKNRVRILPIELEHVLTIENLPYLHKDPFDRMLVAQAVWEQMIILSKDPEIKKYPVTVTW